MNRDGRDNARPRRVRIAKLALRLWRDLARRRLRPRTRLARGRHGRRTWCRRFDDRFTDRALTREEIGNLFAGQRLELEQALGEHFEIGALLVQNLSRLRVSGLDQLANLG